MGTTPWNVELAWWLTEWSAGEPTCPNCDDVTAWFWLTVEPLESTPELWRRNRHFWR